MGHHSDPRWPVSNPTPQAPTQADCPPDRYVSFSVLGIEGPFITLRPDNGTQMGPMQGVHGRVSFLVPGSVTGGAWVDYWAPGYAVQSDRLILPVDNTEMPAVTLGGSSGSLVDRAKIRGAMWSVRWAGRFGPRPGDPDNILAMDYYEHYNPDERARMIEIYKSRGYTHAVTGPMIDPDGYHGQFPTFPGPLTQAWWDHYLDCMQEWVSAGITPVHFVHPDGWNQAQMETLVPFYQQPRAQALLTVIVGTGWEPAKYEWSSYTWAGILKRWSEVMPQALWLLHTVSDVDAPVGVDANGNDNQNPGGNGDGWRRVVPYVHGWLIQNGPYGTSPSADPTLAQNFGDQFNPNAPHSIAAHLKKGYAGWPTNSAWGNVPIRLYNAECTAYESYWKNLPESASRPWGDLARQSGSDGYLDGGTIA